MKKICGIYKFTNKVNGKVYIGKSVDVYYRYKDHINKCNRGQKCLFYNALRKYGIEGFNYEIILECSIEELNYWEKYYISYYKSNVNRYGNKYGYNCTDGGDGLCGHEPWNKGKVNIYSDETRKSMGAHNIGNSYLLGHHHSEESKKLISKHSKGKKESEETRKKKSISKSGAGNAMYGKPCPNANKHRVWNDDTHTKYHYE